LSLFAPHWRAWLTPETRCLVPVSAVSESTDEADPATGKKLWAWFAFSEDLPLFAFTGIWATEPAHAAPRRIPSRAGTLSMPS
jgi:putative SOS response-associated peptidase YedK